MPAPVTAPTACGAEAVCPENRVKALDVLTWPRVGVRSPESPDRRWENRPRYDGKAVGTVLARYDDPTTGQFLTVDPKVATTLSPYGYLAGNPLNGTDPSGKCGGLFSSDSCLTDVENAVGSFFSGAGTDLQAIGSGLYQHLTISAGICVYLCGSVQFQDGYLSLSGGGGGASEWGPGIGWATETPHTGLSGQYMAGIGWAAGVGVSMGQGASGLPDPCNSSVTIFSGGGVYAGGEETVTFPVLPWH